MKLLAFATTVLGFSSNVVGAASSNPFGSAFECLKLKQVLDNIPVNQIANLFQSEYCSRGCKLRKSDYEHQLRAIAGSVIETESANMGESDLSSSWVSWVEHIMDKTYETCLDEENADEDFCRDPSRLTGFTKCVKSNFWFETISNPGLVLPMFLGSGCANRVKFLSNPELWDTTLAGYMRKASETCLGKTSILLPVYPQELNDSFPAE
ncbi:hypothetical protein N7471_011966 [Penicillium samsonianum]|uniref:uncharacterized protein n=1 Tax=Penicillium samsonianum TaxID=1882272 RepID=UPI0025475D71|nr:uncharacterized protein N7471_011966 [Penicillium samsonianum]KAJ6124649.1 hypothetical protein N7471_011966 [Penicillium samsonianum]